ncbi:MAG: ECF transporter S component [Bacillota bacterium]|nr:ECF transporter S component [Bacillota bacterium]
MEQSVIIPGRKRYWKNRDLLIIAVLSGIGGVMSTYVGYLGNLLNRMLGVPFGAGQFVAGLHVFWIILAAGLVRKRGAATATGLLKGIIELLTGSTHGIAIVLISLVQGLLADLLLALFRRHSLAAYMVAGGVSSASNVLMFQILYFSGAPIPFLLFIGGLAFISGILLGGSFAQSVMEIVVQARPVRISGEASVPASDTQKVGGWRPKHWGTLALTVLLSAGALYYFTAVFELPGSGPQLRVEGAVEQPVQLQLSELAEHRVTITAELIGEITHVPPSDYTGVPVSVILEKAVILPQAEILEVTATDGYTVTFDIWQVMEDDQMILIEEEETLRLIAGAYPGGHWVRMVNRMIVR